MRVAFVIEVLKTRVENIMNIWVVIAGSSQLIYANNEDVFPQMSKVSNIDESRNESVYTHPGPALKK